MGSRALRVREAEWQRTVIECAQVNGWTVAHFRPARTQRGWRTPVEADGAGFPDLVLVRDQELIFAELKSERGRLQPNQRRWIERLASVGAHSVEVHVWRPRDWEHIRARLGSLGRQAVGDAAAELFDQEGSQ